MAFIRPKLPPYDGIEWEQLSFRERARLVCEAWCLDGYGTPSAIHLFYLLKVVGYIALWFLFCGFTPGMGAIDDVGQWWTRPIAFQKAILLTMTLEGLGVAGSSGPLTGRYLPPFGGFLYFLRPGTTKLSLFPNLPMLGGTKRTVLDVAIYVAILALSIFALASASIPTEIFIALGVLVPLMGLADKTVFLAFRAEHYWPTILCFAVLDNWIGGAKAVQLAIWFWAGVSKLNHHFPTVVAVMISNHPILQSDWLRRRLYRSFPNDVRPSRITTWISHVGTAFELFIPLILGFALGGWPLAIGLALMVGLHLFIFTAMPMAVPLEWNVMAVFGGFFLFFAHPETPFWAVESVPLGIFLVIALVAVPLLGNLFPDRLSFLVSMRYYAGNWPYNVWLFRGDSVEKIKKMKMSVPWVHDQLGYLYDESESRALIGKVLGFRLMHLQGRAIPELIPKAIGGIDSFTDYEYFDGELIGGMVLGWNFGDGHLNNDRLLHNVQEQCCFTEGELMCICVEAQPLGRPEMKFRIHDAKTGLLEEGTVDVNAMLNRQPWDTPQ